MWTKYTYVCNDCDAMIEITTRQDLKEHRGWCACGSGSITLIGYLDATVMTGQDHVTDITPSKVVKINTNPYN